MDPIENRYKDEEARAQATRDLRNSIVDYRKSVDSIPPNQQEMVCYSIGNDDYCISDAVLIMFSMFLTFNVFRSLMSAIQQNSG